MVSLASREKTGGDVDLGTLDFDATADSTRHLVTPINPRVDGRPRSERNRAPADPSALRPRPARKLEVPHSASRSSLRLSRLVRKSLAYLRVTSGSASFPKKPPKLSDF